MATARQFPGSDVLIDITISANGTVPNAQGYLGVGDGTQIEFSNAGSAAVLIEFTPGTFSQIQLPSQSNSSPISSSEQSVNYLIKGGGGQILGGPYAIQWGNGALPIRISANGGPFTIAIPAGVGKIRFVADADYDVAWSDGNGNAVTVWSPQPSEIYPTPPGQQNPNPVQIVLPNAPSPVICTFTNADNVPQKGTVHVGS